MSIEHLKVAIATQIVMDSGLDQKRDYLGMSQISQCPKQLYNQYFKGIKLSDQAYRAAWRGYLYEKMLKDILTKAGYFKVGSEREIVALFDKRFKGHTDGETIHGELLELKSMKHEDFVEMRLTKRIPRKHYDQVQCYMRWGNYEYCFVVVIDTQTSEVEVAFIRRDDRRGDILEEKARYILTHIDNQNAPVCECKRCA